MWMLISVIDASASMLDARMLIDASVLMNRQK